MPNNIFCIFLKQIFNKICIKSLLLAGKKFDSLKKIFSSTQDEKWTRNHHIIKCNTILLADNKAIPNRCSRNFMQKHSTQVSLVKDFNGPLGWIKMNTDKNAQHTKVLQELQRACPEQSLRSSLISQHSVRISPSATITPSILNLH